MAGHELTQNNQVATDILKKRYPGDELSFLSQEDGNGQQIVQIRKINREGFSVCYDPKTVIRESGKTI